MQTFKPTQEMITAAEAVFVAMAAEQTIAPIVTKYEKDILEAGQWKPDAKWTQRVRGLKDEVILDPSRAYLLPEPAFQTFLNKCKEARKAAGLHVENDEQCPLLVAQSNVRKTKHALVDAMKSVTGVGSEVICRSHDDKFKKYVELSLKLLAPFVRSAPELLANN